MPVDEVISFRHVRDLGEYHMQMGVHRLFISGENGSRRNKWFYSYGLNSTRCLYLFECICNELGHSHLFRNVQN